MGERRGQVGGQQEQRSPGGVWTQESRSSVGSWTVWGAEA